MSAVYLAFVVLIISYVYVSNASETLKLNAPFTLKAMKFATGFMSKQNGYKFQFEKDFGTDVMYEFRSDGQTIYPTGRFSVLIDGVKQNTKCGIDLAYKKETDSFTLRRYQCDLVAGKFFHYPIKPGA